MNALITGASGGLGAEFAKLFAADGYNLILIARRLEKLNELKTELENNYGISVTVFSSDLSEETAAQKVFDFVQSQNLSIDILVNNAGFGDWAFFSDSNLQKQQMMINLNIYTLTTLTHLFLTQMIQRKSGRILNVASIAGFMPGPKMSVYYASKAFVRSFTEALSVELKKTKSGVTVTALCPGPISTDFWNKAEADKSQLSKRVVFANSKKIARYGYKCLMKGKVIALPGASTRIITFWAKFLPIPLVRNLVYFFQK